MSSRWSRLVGFAASVAALGVFSTSHLLEARQPAPTLQERVAALKRSLQESQARIRQYEWIETTIVSVNGEEKTRKKQRCYYGADGALQKLPVGDAPAQAPPPSGGRRGGRLKTKVVENKKQDIQEYMERAVALVHQYVPPNPAGVQRTKDAGRVTVGAAAPGRARLELTGYLKPGDRLAIDLDPATNRLLGLNVASYLDKADEPVTLDVQLGALSDGTSYVAHTTLDAAAKHIRVVIENAGYRPLGK